MTIEAAGCFFCVDLGGIAVLIPGHPGWMGSMG